MKRFKKRVSVFLIFSILACYLPGFLRVAYAATPITLTAYAFDSGTLTLRWTTLANAKSVRVLYHRPLQHDAVEAIINQSTNTTEISGLQDDIIYDIYLEIYNDQDCTGSLLGTGLLYFCPRITFNSRILEQDSKPVSGGGYEIGVTPGLNLNWAVPKVWVPDPLPADPENGSFEYVNESASLQAIQNKIYSVYKDGRELSTFNFRINLSTDYTTLNSSPTQSALLINQSASEYTANVSGNNTVTAKVYDTDADGYMNFDLIGRVDIASDLPEPDSQYQLPDGEILPGTVYYMNIKPIVKNTAGNSVNAITVGAYLNQNGSILSGAVPYTYTPVRFQISRDEAANVYVKVYRINQGSLDLPGLKYEIQTSDDPTIEGDWKVRKWLNDSFFPNNSSFAVTAFTVTNVNNLLYYKVVVKTDSSDDRLESPRLPYTLAVDTSRPPVPSGLSVINKALVSGQYTDPVTHESSYVKSNDITISWSKPANWDEIVNNTAPYDESKDLYYHILISTNQSDLDTTPYPPLEANGKIYGNFPVRYRLVKYVSALSENIRENGSHLEYTIKGLDLFTVKGSDLYGGVDGESDIQLSNDEGYPTFLLSNKIYYLQMYTTTGENKGSSDPGEISDKSVPISFSTLAETGKDVPLPINFRLNKNDTETKPGPPASVSNVVELQFDKVNINPLDYTSDSSVTKAVYYDLYASTSTETDKFIVIGSTEYPDSDVDFIGTDIQSTSVRAVVKEFSQGSAAYDIFGPRLRPNSTYYFMVKTRVAVGNVKHESLFTSILPVTTVKTEVSPPDESSRLPLSPTDFAVAEDTGGNPLVTGSSVTFDWTNKEPDVSYNIICTTQLVAPDAPSSSYTEDPFYSSFNAVFGQLSLDPSAIPLADKFEYDPAAKSCRYTINSWLSPNKLYYFSIRAVDKTTGKTSYWVSIPVTTLLIDPPGSIEAVNDTELELFWNDDSPSAKTEDFKIYLKGPDDSSYLALNKSQFTVSKDGSTYYGRILNLKPNSVYSIRVYKGNTDLSLITEKTGINTKDSCHSVQVKWKGQTGYRYEIAVKTSEDADYTVISDYDLEQYTDKDGHILPYYIEKPAELSSTGYYNFYGKINTMPVKQYDGSVKHLPLSSNMKYYIKVRCYKIDPMDTSIVSYSKYAGPVDIRTDFNQDDYDESDEDTKNSATFLDRIDKLEEELFWKASANSSINKLLIKGDRLLNSLENNGRYPFVLDISNIGTGVNSSVLYIPVSIIKLLNSEGKSLVIKAPEAEFTIRPRTIDLESADTARLISSASPGSTKDVFFKLSLDRSSNPDTSMPGQTELSSKIARLDIKAMLTTKTDSELEGQIKDKLYNKNTGLVQEKLNMILSQNNSLSSKELEAYLSDQIEDIEKKLSDFIDKLLGDSGQVTGIIAAYSGITLFNDPMGVKLPYSYSQGQIVPYVSYANTNLWNKISNFVLSPDGSATFSVSGTGRYALLSIQNQINDIPQGYYAANDISRLRSKYDLNDVFGAGSSFYPDSPVSVRETILLYEKLTTPSINSAGLDLKQKCTKLGLDAVLNPGNAVKDIERQEFASVLAKLYASKMGISIESITPSRKLTIKDEISISNKYFKSVLICLDSNILTLDEKGNFRPNSSMTRAEVVTAIVRLLELTGDI